jgi:PTH1 family peptidyl-tRNA hydrolase
MKLIVGLGNPGNKYINTRHNAGFWFIDILADYLNLKFFHNSKFNADIAQSTENLFLLKPMNFINNSGFCINKFCLYYKILYNEIIIVHDDLDFPCGKIKIKIGGSHGGHKGILSIIESFKTNYFYRMRIGIDRPSNKYSIIKYVLEKPNIDEYQNIIYNLKKTLIYFNNILNDDIVILINNFNKK